MFSFSVLDHRINFPFRPCARFSDKKLLKSSASKANEDCQTLLFDVHVVHRTPKMNFPRRISIFDDDDDDGIDDDDNGIDDDDDDKCD